MISNELKLNRFDRNHDFLVQLIDFFYLGLLSSPLIHVLPSKFQWICIEKQKDHKFVLCTIGASLSFLATRLPLSRTERGLGGRWQDAAARSHSTCSLQNFSRKSFQQRPRQRYVPLPPDIQKKNFFGLSFSSAIWHNWKFFFLPQSL